MSKNASKVIALVILIVVAGGGYILYRKNTQNAPVASDQNTVQAPVANVPEQTTQLPSAPSAPAPAGSSITVNGPGVTVVAEPVKPSVQPQPAVPSLVVAYTDAGFSPNLPIVKAGTKVTFTNNSSHAFWPASGIHPTHEAYPGSSITKCGTPAAATIFDACAPVAVGGTWSFTFNEKGTWPFHDHLNPSVLGQITVQ